MTLNPVATDSGPFVLRYDARVKFVVPNLFLHSLTVVYKSVPLFDNRPLGCRIQRIGVEVCKRGLEFTRVGN